jgi:hypothetical protein
VKVGEVKREEKNEFKPQGEVVTLLPLYPSKAAAKKKKNPTPRILFLRVPLKLGVNS